jgi:hypothetical protein
MATVRAWNSWALEEWIQPYPERFIPCQIPWLRDPQVAADEIRRNAERGFTAVTFSEGPDKLGLPSLHTGYWEPFVQACEETGTVICLHVGSSSTLPEAGEGAPADTQAVLFGMSAMVYTVDWLYSGIPANHPDLRIVMSEGGTGWVAGLLDRLRHVGHYQQLFGNWTYELTPAEVLQRNFYFCAIDDIRRKDGRSPRTSSRRRSTTCGARRGIPRCVCRTCSSTTSDRRCASPAPSRGSAARASTNVRTRTSRCGACRPTTTG